jgi:myo-inositol-1(or 4)-monophosphatase
MEQTMDYPLVLEKVVDRVLVAGKLLEAEWSRPEGPRGAGDKAEVDEEIEARLRHDLLEILDCDFWGEETGHRLSGDEYCWVVDPNDGTADFLKGIKGSSISVGLLKASIPILGVVYAPVTEDRGPDCIAWAEGLPCVLRNGESISSKLNEMALVAGSNVMVSAAAKSKPQINAELCAPADFVAMPSIAYRLARVAAGDGVAAVSIVPVSAHDVVAGHALLIGAGGVLLDQQGRAITYITESTFAKASERCFGGAPAACRELVDRDWGKVFR